MGTVALDEIAGRLRLIDETDGALKAWVHIDRDGATRAARAVDDGRTDGPLAGMAFGVKDIFDVAGIATTAGSRVLADNIAGSDAPVVRAVREAGAVIIGKTNTHEFAYGYVTPPTCNPWDLSRIPGGSSGGSAAAVAAGHVDAALGSDTGGSIRVPAALCGVSGLKPRPGIVSTEGVIPLSPRWDVAGPIARDVATVARVWRVLSGSGELQEPGSFKLGVPPMDVFGDDVEDDVASAYEEAVRVLGKIAASTKDVGLPAFDEFTYPRAWTIMSDVFGVHSARGWWPEKAHLYGDETRSYMEFIERMLTTETVEAAEQEATRLSVLLLRAFDDTDVIATPTVPCTAPTHEEAARVDEETPRRPIALKLGRIPAPVNMAGLAAISVPCGFDANGLPVGLQLIGKDEDLLLAIGAAYQMHTDWHTMRPPIAR